MTLSTSLAGDHHHCDALFASAEQAVESGQWLQAEEAHKTFIDGMEQHLKAEEELLFPAFEEATGMSGGPTMVMRMEHEQMRSLFTQMSVALSTQNADDYLGASETLLILMQQHNAKEEQILYPMLDQALLGQQESLMPQLESRIASKKA